jgi:hypothetical protein
MSKIVELKSAVNQLEVDIAELTDAENAEAQWSHQDQNRRDGSGAQDERHDRMGRDARDRVWRAKQKVNTQKTLIANLANVI